MTESTVYQFIVRENTAEWLVDLTYKLKRTGLEYCKATSTPVSRGILAVFSMEQHQALQNAVIAVPGCTN
jgi:hypothetical protein